MSTVAWVPPPAHPVDRVAVTDRAAVVARLQANHTERGNDTTRPAPLYFGTAPGFDPQDLIRNAAAFAERQDAGRCCGCTPAQLAAQGPRVHWKCIDHGQDASEADRANRVAGSGRSNRR
jgi:hypothetical protein